MRRAAIELRLVIIELEQGGRLLEAARRYGLALEQRPDYIEALIALRRLQAKLN